MFGLIGFVVIWEGSNADWSVQKLYTDAIYILGGDVMHEFSFLMPSIHALLDLHLASLC